MRQVKYVITGQEKVILFSADIQHDRFKDLNPITAGFVTVRGDEVFARGESVSLNIGTRPEDSEKIKRFLKENVGIDM